MSEIRKPNAEEIDLFTFLKPVTTAITNLFVAISNYIKLVVKHLLFLIAVTVFFSLVGFSTRFILPHQFQMEAVMSSHEIPYKMCVLMLNNLQEISASKDNKAVLTKSLGITEAEAKTIVSIKAGMLKDSFFVNDRDTVHNFFGVTLTCSNAALTEIIQKGIVRFLESNDFALKRKEAKFKMLVDLKQSLQIKVASLDSVKNIINNSITTRSQGKGIILGEPINPVTVYQTEINYFRELIDIERQLSVYDNIEVVQPFIPPIKSNYPKFNLILLYFAASGLFLSLILIPLRKNAKKGLMSTEYGHKLNAGTQT